MKVLALLGILLFFASQIAMFYVLAPFVLMHLLQFFGHDVSFWLCMGLCFLTYLSFNLVQGLLKQ